MTTPNQILKLARSQIGYKESPAGSNKNKYGKEYGMNGVPWCAIFIWWLCKHSGDSNLFCGGKKDAYCPTIADYYINHKQTVPKNQGKPADFVLFGFGHTNSQHIGIIEKKNSDGTYTCIEGNTSTGNNCNGGMVMRRKRYQSQINWIVRPKYDSDVKKPSGKYSGVIPTATIRKGDSGTNVKHLQEFLNWYGVRKGDCNGVFGATTEKAQKKYQKSEGIKQTGVFGKTSQAHAEKYKSNGKYTGEWPDWVALSGDIIAQTAKELAWPLGTKSSRYKYPKGKPTDKFYKALCKVYPEHASWKPVSTRKGASCDVGAGTVLRYSGAFPSISRALAKQFPQMEKSAKFKDVGIRKSAQMKAGDVGMYMNKGHGSHIWIALGGKLIAESNFTAQYYFHLVKKNINKSKGHKKYYCFRMTKPIRSYLTYGDEGAEVKKWQKFLIWYGFNVKADGVFGASTLKATKNFQKGHELSGSGDVGAKTIAKAKAVRR